MSDAPVHSHGLSRHVPGECECVRCRGFEPGNQVSVGHGRPPVHGGQSRAHVIARSARAAEIIEEIESVLPVLDEADRFAVLDLAIARVRAERYRDAIIEAEEDAASPLAGFTGSIGELIERLDAAHKRWMSVVERYESNLGLTTASRARLGLDLARARRLSVVDLHAQAAIEAEEDGDA